MKHIVVYFDYLLRMEVKSIEDICFFINIELYIHIIENDIVKASLGVTKVTVQTIYKGRGEKKTLLGRNHHEKILVTGRKTA